MAKDKRIVEPSTVDKLAASLTNGAAVAAASMALQVGGPAKIIAEQFFAARTALGIRGYANAPEAVDAIRRSLNGSPK
jgi:hypothetical protein